MTQSDVVERAVPVAEDAPRAVVRGSILVRLSLILSIGVGICSLAGIFGRASWWLELFSHFRLHYTLVLAGLTLVPLYARRWKVLAFVGSLFLLHAASLLPAWLGSAPSVAKGRNVRVVMWNVLTANPQHDEVLTFLQECDADIILLLEIDHRWLQDLRRRLPAYEHVAAAPRGDNFGIALFSRWPFEGGAEPEGIVSQPVVRASFQLDDCRFDFIGLHAMPPRNGKRASLRNRAFDAVIDTARRRTVPLVLLGDMNVTRWSPYFDDLLTSSGLVDARRGFGILPTWPATWGPLGIPIDQCLVSPEIGVRSFDTGPSAGSDHRAVVVDLTLPTYPVAAAAQ